MRLSVGSVMPDRSGALLRCAGDPGTLGDAGSLRNGESAAAPRQPKYRSLRQAPTGTQHRAGHRSEDSAAAKIRGRCKSVDDLQARQGIGPKRPEKMRKYLTVDAPTAETEVHKRSAQMATSSLKVPSVKLPAKKLRRSEPPATGGRRATAPWFFPKRARQLH